MDLIIIIIIIMINTDLITIRTVKVTTILHALVIKFNQDS